MLTIREVAEASGLPTETSRRYLKQFAEFCPSAREGRRILYDDEVVRAVVRVRALYDQGLSTEEIRAALAQELTPTLDAEVVEDRAAVVAPPLAPEVVQALALLPRMKEVLEAQQERIVALEGAVTDRQTREQALAVEVKRGQDYRVRMDEERRQMRGEIDKMVGEIGKLREERKKGVWERLRSWFW
ncbi:MAG: MerR family transcriptional regulator [Bacilli bacterium]|jgi:DNA-binding transcriptional MerR regulator